MKATIMAPIVLSELARVQLRDLLIFASNKNMFVSLGRLPYDVDQERLFFVEVSAGHPPVFAHVEARTAIDAIDAMWRLAEKTIPEELRT